MSDNMSIHGYLFFIVFYANHCRIENNLVLTVSRLILHNPRTPPPLHDRVKKIPMLPNPDNGRHHKMIGMFLTITAMTITCIAYSVAQHIDCLASYTTQTNVT